MELIDKIRKIRCRLSKTYCYQDMYQSGHAYESPYLPEGWSFNGTMTLSPWFEDPCLLLGPGDEAPASFEVYDGSNVGYRDYKLFLIFEDSDVERLIKVLEWARHGCKDPNPGEVF